jgi:hypothetical protein
LPTRLPEPFHSGVCTAFPATSGSLNVVSKCTFSDQRLFVYRDFKKYYSQTKNLSTFLHKNSCLKIAGTFKFKYTGGNKVTIRNCTVKNVPPSEEQERPSSKSGVLPRPVLEPENRHEPPVPPTTLPELKDSGATTGTMPAVREGHDSSAVGDVDRINGN